jgi:uncharacterized membrane protein YebE (DUF533 family)
VASAVVKTHSRKRFIMVFVAGGAVAAGLVGYGLYKVYKYATAVQAVEAQSAGADAGTP